MIASRSQMITLVIATTTLISNMLSSLLFNQLPDDPYHLASSFTGYLYFANILSVCGIIGTLRKHAPSIAIFSNYLLLDTILCSFPRFLILGLLQTFTTSICVPASYTSPNTTSGNLSLPSEANYTSPSYGLESQIGQLTEGWTEEGCVKIVWLAQVALLAGVVAATLLQFLGALFVREYAKRLWIRELGREDIVLAIDMEEEEGMVEKF